MEFDDVRAFVTVANLASVSLAARQLNITQPAVTRRLQRLETSLGAILLNRRTRPVVLTSAGQATLERCRRLLNNVQEVKAAASARGALKGELRIGVAHALTEFALTEPVGQIRHKFPKVALRLSTGWSRELVERVRSGALDSAVILLAQGEPLPPEVAGKQIAKERLLVVASRQTAAKRFRTVQDLAETQWVLNPEGCAARAGLRRALLHANIDLLVAVEAYNYELQLSLVAQNRGLSLVPERILTRSAHRSRLCVLKIPGLEFPLVVWVIHRERFSRFDQVLSQLCHCLREKLGARPL
jgi:DNA-binding transcriptional LysR family regulator